MLGLAGSRQPVVFLLYGSQLVGSLLAEGLRHPVSCELPGVLRSPSVDVPSQLHAELKLRLGRLYVAYVDYPLGVHAVPVALCQLITNERRRYARQPEIGRRSAEIGQMIVYSVASAARLLGVGRQLAYVAMVVVHPQERHVVGHLQSGVVGVEHLLIRYEGLRNGRRVTDRVGKELSLVGYYLRESAHLVGCCRVAVDALVVHTAHSERVDGVISPALSHSVSPVFLHHRLVGGIVEVAVAVSPVAVPLPKVVAQHLLAVARTEHYVVAACHGQIVLVCPERLRLMVHGRPQGIGSETEQQFHHLGIGLRTHVSVVGLEVVLCPHPYAPVFVVDEYAPVFHGRLAHQRPVTAHMESLSFLRSHVSPPYEGRHSCQTRYLEQSVCRAARRAAEHHESLVESVNRIFHHLQTESLPLAFYSAHVESAAFHHAVYERRLSYCARYHGGSGRWNGGEDGRSHTCHRLNVTAYRLCGSCHNLSVGGVYHERHGTVFLSHESHTVSPALLTYRDVVGMNSVTCH